MSYVRFSRINHPWNYDSDIYIYPDTRGGITCCGCCLRTTDFIHNVNTFDEMIEHVKQHIASGDAVPDFVIPNLEEAKITEPEYERHNRKD